MSLSNTTELAALAMFLQGTDPAYRAGATQYLALFTADPTETGGLGAEANYTGYARVAGTKASVFAGSGITRTNGSLIQWGKANAEEPLRLHPRNTLPRSGVSLQSVAVTSPTV